MAESFFSEVRYSGAHDKTALLVARKDVDVGVLNANVVKRMLQEGRLSQEQVHVLWETPPYPDYVWAIQKSIETPLKEKILQAFLELSLIRENPF